MNSNYKEFQFGWLIFAFMIPAYILIVYLYVNELGQKPIGSNGFIFISVVTLLVYLLFYGMTTKINSDHIVITFGIGIIRKRILLNKIKEVIVVTNPWYYGWGIRLIPGGILYNISGNKCIELTFHDTGRKVRIGSKDSSRLKTELEKRIIRT